MTKQKQLNRRDFIKRTVAGTAVALSDFPSFSNSIAEQKRRPNIVLIVSDDHGLDALGCYGNLVIKTPNLDRLAAEGVRFNYAFCTTASCSPSRSVILTGLHNHANGQYGLQHEFHKFRAHDHIISLPVFLSRDGYRTARIGKYHIAPEHVFKFDSVLSKGFANDITSIARSPIEMAEMCSDFIAAKDDRPFFLYFCTDDPHRGLPFDSWPEPNPFGNRLEGYPGEKVVKYDPKDVIVPSFLPDTPECRAELAQYYQSVSRVDQGIGKLIQILKDANQYDNTVIIYISDNGIAFPGAKTTLYEPGMRLPCIVRTPWQKNKGIVNNALVTWTDITPTILDFTGVLPKKHRFHGRSFKNILEDKNPSDWDEIYASHSFHEINMYYPMRVVRGRRYKLIWNMAYQIPFPFAWDLKKSSSWQSVIRKKGQYFGKRSIDALLKRPEYELYDLENDPDEIQNLADDPKFTGMREKLKAKLKKFQADTMDPWISDYSAYDRWKTYEWPE